MKGKGKKHGSRTSGSIEFWFRRKEDNNLFILIDGVNIPIPSTIELEKWHHFKIGGVL